jgi:hypothetical protein
MKRVRKMTPQKTTKMTAPRAPRWTPPARTEAAPIAPTTSTAVHPMPGSAPNGVISHGGETISAVVAWENGPGAVRNEAVRAYEHQAHGLLLGAFNRLMFGGAR